MTAEAKTCTMDAINKGVHLSGAVLFTYSLYYYYTYVNIPARLNPLDEAFGGKFKYLTFCNMVIQTIFYLYAVFVDHIAVRTCSVVTSESLKRSKHNFFTIFAFPLSMVICIYKSGMWVYPILAKLNLPLRVMFFTGSFLYAPITYLVGEYMNNAYWGVRSSNKSNSSKRE
ncbi:PREDICTED: uncharacterized protein LOC107162848 [Diuraphis noxia]|uniref:uncharacterized protein LOC107162848 n=1 Tax=Diuraphis noxia TaxID=143948 RepID=UPI000763A1FC|nr:PREDICTED: uncharacterized protein LOC107162848 [Diuraphis noxia]